MKRTRADRLSHMTCILCGPEFDERTYMRFPKNELRRKKWLAKCPIPEGTDVTYAHLCTKHFHSKDFSETAVQRRRLKNTAVPSLFLDKKSLKEQETLIEECAPLLRHCLLCKYKTTLPVSKFPSDEIERKKWIEHFKIDSAKDVKNARICEKHFDSTLPQPSRKRSSRAFGQNSSVTPLIEDTTVKITIEPLIEDVIHVISGDQSIKDFTTVVSGARCNPVRKTRIE